MVCIDLCNSRASLPSRRAVIDLDYYYFLLFFYDLDHSALIVKSIRVVLKSKS